MGDGTAAAQVVELQAQLARARMEIVRLEDVRDDDAQQPSGTLPAGAAARGGRVTCRPRTWRHRCRCFSADDVSRGASAEEVALNAARSTSWRRNALHARVQQLQALVTSAPGTP